MAAPVAGASVVLNRITTEEERAAGKGGLSVSRRPPVFYPSSSSVDGAVVITLGLAETRTDINISLLAGSDLARLVSLSGLIAGGPTPLPALRLRLVPRGLESGVALALERTGNPRPSPVRSTAILRADP